jgi:clusterin-associated protein 1
VNSLFYVINYECRKECEELEADEKNIEIKIKKKKEEYERTEKRLKNLENVRPQFMDEVEKLEKELQRYYEVYVEKYRNMDYLEAELTKYHRNEEERKEEHDRRLKKMRERLLKEEVELLRGGRGLNDDDVRATGASSKSAANTKSSKADSISKQGNSRVQGSMAGNYSDEGSSDDGNSEESISQASRGSGSEDDDGDLSTGSRQGRGGRRETGSDVGSEDFIDDDDDGGDSEFSGDSGDDF